MEEIAEELKATYLTFDDVGIMAGAMSDPIGFLSDQPKPLILDEIQRVPELFISIKRDVDRNRHPGRYALTGSANPLMLPCYCDQTFDLTCLDNRARTGFLQHILDKFQTLFLCHQMLFDLNKTLLPALRRERKTFKPTELIS